MIDRHLMNMADAEARLEEEFAERVCELLNEEWNPENFDNFMEAIHDDCLYPFKEAIQTAIVYTDYQEYGRLIFKAVEAYCIERAEDQANEEFARGLN